MILLQYLGSAETELLAMSMEDILLHALANTSDEGGYVVCHGTCFVSTFPGGEGDESGANFST